jgi:hypothetical protein
VVLWFCGFAVLRFCGFVVLWFCSFVVLWFCGLLCLVYILGLMFCRILYVFADRTQHQVPWSVVRLGARVEYCFTSPAPRNGSQAYRCGCDIWCWDNAHNSVLLSFFNNLRNYFSFVFDNLAFLSFSIEPHIFFLIHTHQFRLSNPLIEEWLHMFFVNRCAMVACGGITHTAF